MKNGLILFILILSSCAGIDFYPKRWVADNTFYSTKLPDILVHVREDLRFQRSKVKNKLISGERGKRTTGKKIETFDFFNNDVIPPKEVVRIIIETLTAHENWYMVATDYNTFSNSLSAREKILSGMRFATGVFVIDKVGYALLISGHTRVVGDTTRLIINYWERVDKDWLEKNPDSMSKEDSEFLENFIERAESSFTISEYDGTSPPVSDDSANTKNYHPTKEGLGLLKSEPVVGTTITLKRDTQLYWYGKVKYTAKEGDKLTIIKIKPCRSDPSLECWIVEHENLGKGAMRAEYQ